MNKEEQTRRLLYAFTDVDDRFITEAAALPDTAGTNRKNKTLTFRKVLYFAAAAAACLTALLVGRQLVHIGNPTAVDSVPVIQDGNPVEEVGSMEEAAAITGFTLEISGADTAYTDESIVVYSGTMIEINFAARSGGNGYSIRKAAGSADISGDSNTYVEVRKEKINGHDVTIKGDGSHWSLAVWTSGGYSYAVSAQNNPMTLSEIMDIVSKTQ